MSPKQMTRLALSVAAISLVGAAVMLILRPEWGWLSWWPALGLALALLLLAGAYLRGAYLSTQRRVAMVDKLNDCYSGVPETADPAQR